MRLSAQQIAELVKGKALNISAQLEITGAEGLAEAGASDISFLGNPKYADMVSQSKAGLVLMPESAPDTGRPVILVKNPQLAFAQILTIIDKERSSLLTAGIHPTAVIMPGARIGAGVAIGPHAVIDENAVIGDRTRIGALAYIGNGTMVGADCVIYAHVTLRERVSLGDRVIVHPGTVVGSDGFGFVPSGAGIFKIPQIGTVAIEDDVEIGANVTIDRATTGATRIGKGTKIDNLVQIAHNVQIGACCMIVAQVGISGSTKLGNGVVMAGQCGTAGHLSIGDRAVVAGRAGVTTDIPAGQTYSGFPARPHREELKNQALVKKLPALYEEVKQIKAVTANKSDKGS